ncbi:HNH endonuclease protein (plasmid) [Rhizobium phaseoli]|uniref:HNH endonuclease n=1 Tax=Rhizobium phaseoli TaxID=396 RepID=UPI0007E95E4B|nr:HNH endonuclease [Rhizobium phaseoli]ANM08332.1 HNH endonuclease protein [Rhizobium phaseoli]
MTDARLVRDRMPVRSVVVAREAYQAYRADLQRDFFHACGYCGDEDERIDSVVYHIDHFAPKTRFPALETDYKNLVYACRYCNISKSDHWIGNDAAVPHDGARGFVDPCTDDYEKHLVRQDSGRIVGSTELGKYVAKRLRLNLIRHELLWQARRARRLRRAVEQLLTILEMRGEDESSDHHKLLKRYRALNEAIEDYELRAHAQP